VRWARHSAGARNMRIQHRKTPRALTDILKNPLPRIMKINVAEQRHPLLFIAIAARDCDSWGSGAGVLPIRDFEVVNNQLVDLITLVYETK
jgi:hypothetical protein